MSLNGDVIRDLIQRLLVAASREGTFTEAVAIEVERQWRQDNRGEQYTICAKPRPDDETKAAAVADYLDNRPLEEITGRHNISRATLYRYLKR